ncbi:MAG: hypothetical protein JNK53_00620 [Phycisphaerae bacterium]|nr:hypothetical protein [Phycisphaerae bacterium]
MTARGKGSKRLWWMVLASPCAALAVAWMLGRVLRDQWNVSQVLFWIPAPVALLCAVAAIAAMRCARGGRTVRAAAWVCAAAAAWSLGHAAYYDVGWCAGSAAGAPTTSPQMAQAIVVHWNPRAPGDRAVECGTALGSVHADILVLSNPGSMLRGSNASEWVPAGWYARDQQHVAVVSRWPIRELRVLVHPEGVPSEALWAAWAEVEDGTGGSIRMLIVDLPSNPRSARGDVVGAVKRGLAAHARLSAPNLVMGDFNSVEGSVLFDVWPDMRAPPPWRSCGWLGTFPRVCPLWRIDWMLSAPRDAIERYETLDLGRGLHRAQRAVVRCAPTS